MSTLIKHSLLASVLATTSFAQNTSKPESQSLTCDDLSESLAYNASIIQNTTALNLVWLGDEERVAITEDDQTTWTISSYIGPGYNGGMAKYDENETQAVLWLDTGDSNMERLGDIIGLCHSFVPLQNRTTGDLTWSREVLERASEDDGDCKTMLGTECVEALESWYRRQGQAAWNDDQYPPCSAIQNTIPSECEGMLSEAVTMDVVRLNTSAEDRIWKWDQGINITSFSDDVTVPTCGDRNLSSSWGNRIYQTIDYDVALNFPIVDIMTFYPTVSSTRGGSSRETHAKVVCLKPENIQEGSRAPRSVKEVLDEYYGPHDDESGAERVLGRGGEAVLALASSIGVGLWLQL
ncbi:hypothetical protein AA0117_g811 [Alternaria alternata]|uniref:Uncharacterized protein n=1 Tax=Alternaria alternata TaxID=5599 RepID=A0A4Q4NWB7_ALTAL|nr:hypothetical protein AA0117_g811 [Alternaria alternata]